MMLKSLKHAGWPALLAFVAMAACTKTAAPEDVFVSATVGAGSDPLLCSNSSSASMFFSVGQTNTSNFPTTVPSGQGPLVVECKVAASNGGYDLALSANTGTAGGAFVLMGHVDASGGKGLRGHFAGMSDAFSSSDCTVTYTYNRLPIKPDQTVSPGQIFGHVDCPDAVTTGTANVMLPDGGLSPETCDAYADFLFQNCSE